MERFRKDSTGVSISTSAVKKIRFSKDTDVTKEELEREKQNPLDIPEIVAIVADQIRDFEDMKSVRSQSKAWRDETLSKWRDSAVFLINDESIPVLVKAFDESDFNALSEEDRLTSLSKKDPLRLCDFPFLKYRFGNRKSKFWTYPVDANDSDGNVIWEEVIRPHATYLDLGVCILEQFTCHGRDSSRKEFSPGLKWILSRCRGSLAMAPLVSKSVLEILPDSGDGDFRQKRRRTNPFNEGFWMMSSFKPEITSFSISTPERILKGFKPLMEGLDLKNYSFGKFVIGAMINLKHLKLPFGTGASSIMNGLSDSANFNLIRLESLTALASNDNYFLSSNTLLKYLTGASPPLRELSVSLTSLDFLSNSAGIYPSLRSLQKSLVKLELEINCELGKEGKDLFSPRALLPGRFGFSLRGFTFPNLTNFKISLDYDNSPRLATFNLNHLKRMPKLEEFYFGYKNKVELDWVKGKLQFDDDNLANFKGLQFLKSFHFHGNFSKESLRRLGVIAGQLETLEVVLDAENFNVVEDIWPRLRRLKLLEGSDVPEEDLLSLKESYSLLKVL